MRGRRFLAMWIATVGAWTALVMVAGSFGCRSDQPEAKRVPKAASTETDPHAGLPPDMRPGTSAGMTTGGAPGDAAFHWHAPDGWIEKPPSSMRLGSYEVPGPSGAADMSIVVLSGPAGGALPNVNRWRGQIGLAPLADDAALARESKTTTTSAGQFLVVEFAGQGDGPARLLAAILPLGGETWFFKMTGPDASVAAARPDFMRLLESVHDPSHED